MGHVEMRNGCPAGLVQLGPEAGEISGLKRLAQRALPLRMELPGFGCGSSVTTCGLAPEFRRKINIKIMLQKNTPEDAALTTS